MGGAQAHAQCSEQKITTAVPKNGDRFGFAVSVSGTTALIGADGDDCAAGTLCGAAYVRRFNGTTWVAEQKLTASDAAGTDQFGSAVSVSGDTAIVGAHRVDCAAGAMCGAAYLFNYNGTSWIEQQKLTASDAASGDVLGGAVSVNGTTAIVGALGDDCAAGLHCGAAYIFRFDGTSWVEAQKLTASDAAAEDLFGISVSLSGNTAIVGAYRDDCAAGVDCGAAYVYRFDGTSWVEEQKLTASDAADSDVFGLSVSVDGNTAVVGAFGDDCAAGVTCGSAYVYRFDGTTWVEEQKLRSTDPGAGEEFGFSVSVSGTTAVVGARSEDCTFVGSVCGAAFVYRYNGSSWVLRQRVTASDAASGDGFAGSVSVSAETVMAGASGNDCAPGLECGAAYVFQCLNLDIPASSSWGLVVTALLGVCLGVAVFGRSRRRRAAV